MAKTMKIIIPTTLESKTITNFWNKYNIRYRAATIISMTKRLTNIDNMALNFRKYNINL